MSMFSGVDFEREIRSTARVLIVIGAIIGIVGYVAVRWLLNHVHIAF